MKTQLPIDVVPGSYPPVFVWKTTVDTIAGRGPVDCREFAPSPLWEKPLVELINLAKQRAAEIERLMKENEDLRRQAKPTDLETALADR